MRDESLLAGEISRIEDWPRGIKLARWKDHDIASNFYNIEWSQIFKGLRLAQGIYLGLTNSIVTLVILMLSFLTYSYVSRL